MQKIGRYGALNVVLHPHPDGSYEALFRAAAERSIPVKYFGDRFAKLSPISETRDGVFSGRLATWSEINTDGNLIDKDTLNEMLFAEANIALPRGVGFNSRVFTFAFRISDHRLFFELMNDENERISVGAVQKILLLVLYQVLPPEQELAIHIVSSSSSVANVLKTPGLKKLEIEVNLPNPDVLTDKKGEVVESMRQMRARKMRVELTKMAGDEELSLSPGVQTFAELAAENGFAKAVGRDQDGKTVERSTKDFPLEVETVLNQEESRAIATRRIAAE